MLDFAPAAARAWIIASRFGNHFLQLRFLGSQDQHHLCRSAVAAQQLGHDPHGTVDMFEERFVARAQVIQSGLPIRCLEKAVLGALAMTGKAHLAFTAAAGQPLTLLQAKLPLLLGSHQVDHMMLCDVAEQIVRLDKVVTRIEIAVMLQG